jgi:hypothetical protein
MVHKVLQALKAQLERQVHKVQLDHKVHKEVQRQLPLLF